MALDLRRPYMHCSGDHPDDCIIDEMLRAVAHSTERTKNTGKRRYNEPSCAVERAISTAKRAAPGTEARIVLEAMPYELGYGHRLAPNYMATLMDPHGPSNMPGVIQCRAPSPHLKSMLSLLMTDPTVPRPVSRPAHRIVTEPREALRALFGRLVHWAGPLLATSFFGHIMGYHAGPVAERFSGAVIGAAMVNAPQVSHAYLEHPALASRPPPSCPRSAMCVALHRGILYTLLGHDVLGCLGGLSLSWGSSPLSGLGITNAYQIFVGHAPVAAAYARALGARTTTPSFGEWMVIRLRCPELVDAFFAQFYPVRLWPADLSRSSHWNWQKELTGPASGEGEAAQRLRHADEQVALGRLTPAAAVTLVLQ